MARYSHRPVIIGHPEALDTFCRYADLFLPDLRCLVVIGVDSDPQPVWLEPKTTVGNGVGQQCPRMLDSAFLEVVAKREIARHLEERIVARGNTHLFNIQRAHALLNTGGGSKWWILLTQEVRFERNHAGVHEQQVWVVENQRGTGNFCVASVGEVLDKALANFMRLHVTNPSNLGDGYIQRSYSRPPWTSQGIEVESFGD